MSEQTIIPSFAGLNVNDDQNISSPGSLIEAFDVVCDRPGVIESAHSFNQFNSPLSNPIDQNMQLDNTMLLHSDNKIFVDDGGVWTQKSGAYITPAGATAIRSTEVNDSLYFTENTGIKVLDSPIAGSIREAGIPRPGELEVNVTGQYAFTNGDISQNTTAAQGYTSSVSLVDDNGNRYIAFAGAGNGGYSLSKYDYLGNLLWKSNSLGQPGEAVGNVSSIGITSTGNIYLSGMYADRKSVV